jgi:hypothetical protein
MSILRNAIEIARDALAPDKVPETLPRIGKSGPPAGLVMPLPRVQRSLLTRPALDADSRKIAAIFDRADRGQTCDLADLYEDCRVLDSRLDAVARKRVLAIMGRPLLIKPAPGWETDKEAKQHAEWTQQLLQRSPGFRSGIAHLAHGTLDLPRTCEQEWVVTREGRYMPVLHKRFPNLFAFDNELRIGFLAYPSAYSTITPLSNYPDHFVVHSPSGGRSSYPWRQGALLSRCIPSIAKRAGVRWWLQYLERFGLPLPYATIPEGEGGDPDTSSSLKGRAKQMLRDLQADWSAVVSGAITLDVVPHSGEVNAEAHARFVEYQDTQDAIVVLGQNLTTQVEGGSFAATEAHRFVADDILEADLLELAADTITTQIVEPLSRYNWPGGPPLVAEMHATRAQILTIDDVAQGICTPDQRLASLGHPAQADGRGSQYRQPMAQVPAQIGAAPGTAAETVAETALNGAQVTSLQGIVAAAAKNEIPISAAKVMIAKAFPTINTTDIDAMFADVVAQPAPIAPAVGGGATPPFAQSSATNTPGPSQTSGRSTHPLANALSQK